MRSVFSFIALAGIGTVAVFGFMTMDHGMEHAGGCVAAMPQGVNCPQGISGLGLTLFHLDALKGFSLAVISGSTALLLLLAVFLSAGPPLTSAPPAYSYVPSAAYRKYLDGSFKPFRQLELSRWLARHDNSPSFA